MAGMALFTGPEPVSGIYFCMVCASEAKAATVNDPAMAAKIAALAEKPDGTREVFEILRGLKINEAITLGYFLPMQAAGLMPLCWTHITGITLTAGGLIQPATPAQMPRGPVLLDGSNRNGG